VRIDGKPARVVSASWLSAEGDPMGPAVLPGDAGGNGRSAARARSGAQSQRGRTVVFFVQKDLHPTRAPGLLQLLDQAGRLATRLGPSDRAAVVCFDAHLKLWQDFTSDTARVRRALTHDLLFEEEPARGTPDGASSLTARLDPRALRRAASPETALLLVGDALRAVAGSKTLVFLGHGLGELRGPTLSQHADYGPARRALLEAGVTVFTLDVTDADHHTLEAGLRQMAEDTGGFYAPTHLFTGQAVSRLEEVLQGHYVLEVVPPGGRRGRHDLRVDLVSRRGEVLARAVYFD